MSRGYTRFGHPGVIIPIVIFGILAVFVLTVLMGVLLA